MYPSDRHDPNRFYHCDCLDYACCPERAEHDDRYYHCDCLEGGYEPAEGEEVECTWDGDSSDIAALNNAVCDIINHLLAQSVTPFVGLGDVRMLEDTIATLRRELGEARAAIESWKKDEAVRQETETSLVQRAERAEAERDAASTKADYIQRRYEYMRDGWNNCYGRALKAEGECGRLRDKLTGTIEQNRELRGLLAGYGYFVTEGDAVPPPSADPQPVLSFDDAIEIVEAKCHAFEQAGMPHAGIEAALVGLKAARIRISTRMIPREQILEMAREGFAKPDPQPVGCALHLGYTCGPCTCKPQPEYVLSERFGRIQFLDDSHMFGTREIAIEHAVKMSRFGGDFLVDVKDVQDRGKTVRIGHAEGGTWTWDIPMKGPYAD